jgi:hypothetical protein
LEKGPGCSVTLISFAVLYTVIKIQLVKEKIII